MKDNTRLYRMIKIQRLQVNISKWNPSSQTQFALETLVEVAMSLQNPEATHDAANFPNIGQAEEVTEDKK